MTFLKVLAAFTFIPALLAAIALYDGFKIEALQDAGIMYLAGVTTIAIFWFVASEVEKVFRKQK